MTDRDKKARKIGEAMRALPSELTNEEIVALIMTILDSYDIEGPKAMSLISAAFTAAWTVRRNKFPEDAPAGISMTHWATGSCLFIREMDDATVATSIFKAMEQDMKKVILETDDADKVKKIIADWNEKSGQFKAIVKDEAGLDLNELLTEVARSH